MLPRGAIGILLAVGILGCGLAALAAEKEVRVHQGAALSPFNREYDNSIKGLQKVDPQKFRLKVHGLVAKPLALTYGQALALPHTDRVVLMNCVEGWSENLLFTGIRLADLLKMAGPKPEARWVIFRAADGYSSAMPMEYLQKVDALLSFKVNGLTLDAKRGFPFWLVAQDKLGYKWVKWVVEVELSAKEYRGFWERRGYSNDARVTKPAKRLVE